VSKSLASCRSRSWLAGSPVNSLKRSIYVGRVAGYQAKQQKEMQAVADALSLLANLVMAWNTMNMQVVLDRWNTRRSTTVPPELLGRIAPTRTEGINLRGVFRSMRCDAIPLNLQGKWGSPYRHFWHGNQGEA
jgi:hypothetical protein